MSIYKILFSFSVAYTARDVLYEWKWPHPVAVANDVTLSQYDYLNITLSNRTEGECMLFIYDYKI